MFGVLIGIARAGCAVEPKFEAQVIDGQIQIGYGVVPADVDGDGKLDIILADKTQFVWYRNGDWKKFVLAENLTVQDNVCVAARDLDGDGRAEIAVGANWNPADTLHSGSVHYLRAPADRTQRWQAIALPHEPTVHRMHWVRLDSARYALVVSPLHGRGNRNGEGAGARLLAYMMPQDPTQPWAIELLDDSMHLTHNLDPCPWYPSTLADELLYIGREGAMLLYYDAGKWNRVPLPRVEGGGEIRMVLLADRRKAIATIEPMHGDRLVLYLTDQHYPEKAVDPHASKDRHDRRQADSPASTETLGAPINIIDRIILDAEYNGGHAIAAGTLLPGRGQQIVAGWRLPNRQGKVGLKLYWPQDAAARVWQSCWIDENGMATEDARLADLDGDGRLDIIAAGRATQNLKVYWNRTEFPQ
jgi:hypothetical protein